MKIVRTVIKSIAVFFTFATVVIFSSLVYADSTVSDFYCVNSGEALELNSPIPIRASYCMEENSQVSYNQNSDKIFKMNIKVLGIIPVKQINVRIVDKSYVTLLGTPFGIKIYTNGVLVVGFTDVDAESGNKNPAKAAGLREGDYIVSLNGKNVYTNEDVSNVIKHSNGELIAARVIQNGKEKTISFYPTKSKSTGTYRAGIWVKDSSAGIGTMTFYSPVYNVVAGLGHGICDSETGTLLSLNSGEFVTAEIVSYTKGKVGKAGELSGAFTGKRIAEFDCNAENGVYGNVTCDISSDNLVPIALKQEVRNASGYILTTIDGTTPQYYTCNIKVRNRDETQNLLVEITDERLLDATGGIVQGMSGSPIIQNGKLVGAVTHVCVNL